MAALGIDLAYVKLAQPRTVLLYQEMRLGHRAFALMRMADIDAKPRVRQPIEDRGELVDRPAGALALVHILEGEHPAELPPRPEVVDRVWMQNHRPAERGPLRHGVGNR